MKPLFKSDSAQYFFQPNLALIAGELLREGAAHKVTHVLTGIKRSALKEIHKQVCNTPPKTGPIQMAGPEYFCGLCKRTSQFQIAMSSAYFIKIYLNLLGSFGSDVHEAFLLLSAYRVYKYEGQSRFSQANRLSIVQAWRLVRLCGVHTGPASAEIHIEKCPVCKGLNLVVATHEKMAVGCPICASSAHKLALSRRGANALGGHQAKSKSKTVTLDVGAKLIAQ